MPQREYCCCAIPVVYAGINLALLEQFVLGVVAGTLSIATPSIVGASTPSYAKWIFTVVCWLGAALQVLGFVAVRQERPILFRRYLTLHSLVTLAAFGIGAAWIGISATRHDQAKSQCLISFFQNNDSSEGDTLCNIWPWADVGVMAGLWVVFAITQTYLYIVVNGFGKAQRRDHSKYQSLLFDSSKSASTIPLADRGAWGSRNSTENLVQAGGHQRQDSNASVATVMADKVQGYADNYSSYPPNAYTQEPGPTPNAYDSHYDNSQYNAYGAGGVGYPQRSQVHPAEGSFRRKTPRLQKPGSEDFYVSNGYNTAPNTYNANPVYDSAPYSTRY